MRSVVSRVGLLLNGNSEVWGQSTDRGANVDVKGEVFEQKNLHTDKQVKFRTCFIRVLCVLVVKM
jgi:hypothetical protein